MNNHPTARTDFKDPACYRYDDILPAASAMLEELLKATDIQQLFESYYNLLNIPVAIIDTHANVLLSSPWQRLCTQFHRVHSMTCARCLESDMKLAIHLQEGKNYAIYACQNGLTDCASPIMIDGNHIANVFIGQFLTKEPDEAWFGRQAEKYGFDVADYLSALREVPIVEAERIPAILELLARMTRVVTKLGIDRKRASESEARQSVILNAIPQSVFWKDTQGRFLGCNAPFARAAGLATTEDIVGKTDFDLPSPRQEAEAYRADDMAVISSKQPRLHIEEPLQQADGSRIVVDTCKIPLVDASNTPYGVVGIYEDITERKQAEEQIEASEEKFRKAFMTGADAFYIATLDDGKVIEVNDAFRDVFGYTRDEVIGKTSLQLGLYVDPIDRQKWVQEIETTGYIRNLRLRGKKKDGNLITMLLSVNLLEGGDEQLIIGVVKDITQLTQAEQALRLNETRLEGLLKLSQMTEASLNEITNFALEQGVALTKSQIGYIYFVSEDEKVLTTHAWSKQAMDQCAVPDKPRTYPLEETGLWGEALRQRRPIITNDYVAPNPYKKGVPAGHVQIVRHLNVPIFEGQRIVVVAGVGNKDSDYDESDIRQLTLLMDGMWKLLRRREAEEALRKSETELKQAHRIARLGDWSMDLMTGQARWSDEVYRMLGVNPSAPPPSYSEHSRLFTPESWTKLATELEKTLRTGVPYELELETVRADGVRGWILDRGESVRDNDGVITQLRGVVLDITERKQAEEALRDSEEKYRVLYESSRDAIMMLSPPAWKFSVVNPMAEELFGARVKQEFMVVEPWTLSPEYQPDGELSSVKAKKMIDTAMERGTHLFEWTHKKFSGEEFFATVNLTRMVYRGQIQLQATVRDITERKIAETKLQKAFAQLKNTLVDSIKTMAKIVELRDPYTAGHQERVASLTIAIAQEMNLEPERIEQLGLAALIHDVGKVHIPSEILSKPGKLTKLEYQLLQTHAQSGYDIVSNMNLLPEIAKTIWQHHERLDGSGYPMGLKGDEIPLESRILSVADAFEATMSHRPYRPARGMETALEELMRDRGKLFDERVCDACWHLFKEKGVALAAAR